MPPILISLETRGFKEIDQLMDYLPRTPVKRAARKSLNKAATPVVKRAKQNGRRIDRSQDDQEARELTRDAKKISVPYRHIGETVIKKAKVSRRDGSPFVVIGPASNTAPHASLVEFDTAPHAIKTESGAVINHPGTRAQPFLGDAYRSTKTEVEQRLARELEKDLAKEVVRAVAKTGALKAGGK